jgi:hypothetical protein
MNSISLGNVKDGVRVIHENEIKYKLLGLTSYIRSKFPTFLHNLFIYFLQKTTINNHFSNRLLFTLERSLWFKMQFIILMYKILCSYWLFFFYYFRCSDIKHHFLFPQELIYNLICVYLRLTMKQNNCKKKMEYMRINLLIIPINAKYMCNMSFIAVWIHKNPLMVSISDHECCSWRPKWL